MGVRDLCARWRAFNALQVAVGAEISVASMSHRTCPVNYNGLAVANSRSWRVPEAPFLGAPDTVRCTSDSPVNYSEAPLDFPEGEEFSVKSRGAPDSPVRQTRAHFGYPFAPLLNLFLGLFIG
jgi:hypothetical protein